ncbi:MAG TPA: MmcQ/YjbR family DNA-binding protein [Pseudonocardia sp.]|nr:MmcQ/YjbR family DNA-binding protein [Pseudonocardia sp.]
MSPSSGAAAGAGRRPDPVPAEALDRLRALCLALPEATERLSHGEPTWFVRDRKVFVTFAGRHHDDRVACWCAAAAEERDALVAEEPDRFFVPPYVGGRGWLGVYLDVPGVDWPELRAIVREAYRLIAPKRLAALL